MSSHTGKLMFTPFAGLMNLARRLGVPDSITAPALRGGGVPESVDLSAAIERKVREAREQLMNPPKPARRLKR